MKNPYNLPVHSWRGKVSGQWYIEDKNNTPVCMRRLSKNEVDFLIAAINGFESLLLAAEKVVNRPYNKAEIELQTIIDTIRGAK